MQMLLDSSSYLDDQALLAQFAKGDRDAARNLTLHFTPRLMRYAIRMLSDRLEAEDVVQETMLRLWHQAPLWQAGGAKIETWLYQVASHLCIDRFRKRKRGFSVSLNDIDEPGDEQPTAEAGLMEKDRQIALYKAIDLLPKRQRQAIVLRHLEDLGNGEIAVIMGIGIEAVESLIARAKRNLGAILAGRQDELMKDEGH